MFKRETGIVKKGRPECSGFREEMVKKCFSTSSELGLNSRACSLGPVASRPSYAVALQRSGNHYDCQRMVALLRPDIPLRTHAYTRVVDRFTASTPPWTAPFSSEAVYPRLIGAGINPHSSELGTETMPLRTA
jgi:hypothetical protein